MQHYALIIGIENYDEYDRSDGLRPGTSRVAGARNDALRYAQQCLAMGIAPEHIRVLTMPKLSAAELGLDNGHGHGGVITGAATAQAISAGLVWLFTSLSEAGQHGAGLLAFSGHADWSRGLLLCPADMTRSLAEVVSLDVVRQALGAKAALPLTIFLDGGRAPASAASIRGRLRGIGTGASEAAEMQADLHDRLLIACGRDQVSVASVFDGEELGAFAWAVTRALDAHSMTMPDAALTDIHCGDLLARVRTLMETRSLAQVPEIRGPADVAGQPLLSSEASRAAAQRRTTFSGPSKERPCNQPPHGQGHQVDGGADGSTCFRVYEMRFAPSAQAEKQLLARFFVTGANSANIQLPDSSQYTLEMNTEYWQVDANVLASMSTASGGVLSLTLKQDANCGALAGNVGWNQSAPTQTIPQLVQWGSPTTADLQSVQPSGVHTFQLDSASESQYSSQANYPVALRFLVTGTGTSCSITNVHWFRSSGNALLFSDWSASGQTLTFDRKNNVSGSTLLRNYPLNP